MKYRLSLLSVFLISFPAWCQIFSPSASEVTEQQAHNLFEVFKSENAKMKKDSECFQRAHIWSLRAERLHGIQTEKVFTFFTYKFKMRHEIEKWWQPIIWWFHVAPAVRVKGELWVLDATFSDSAQPLQKWTDSLMKEPSPCIELQDPQVYADDRNATERYLYTEKALEACYFISAPRFVYDPRELGLDPDKTGKMIYTPNKVASEDWTPLTVNWAVGSYKRKYQKAVQKELKK